jgi:alanine racemase
MKRRVTVEIDLDALVRNYRRIVAHVRPAKVLCVLKANAYGLGVAEYARALAAAGCRAFGVAEPHEAMQLVRIFRNLERPPSVQMLSSVLPDEIAPMVRAGVVLPVTDLESAELISAAAVRAKRRAEVHLKIDTGMGRLGIPASRALEVIEKVSGLPGLDCAGIFSHCPMAYDPGDGFTARQIAAFGKLVAAARSSVSSS